MEAIRTCAIALSALAVGLGASTAAAHEFVVSPAPSGFHGKAGRQTFESNIGQVAFCEKATARGGALAAKTERRM